MQLLSQKGGILELIVDFERKKQPDANVTELIGEDEDKRDVLSVTDKSVGNKNKWIINSGCSQHINFDRKTFSSYNSVQGGGSS